VIIRRYLSWEVFGALFGVTLVLLLAFMSQQIVRYLNYVATSKIPTNVVLELISFEIPYLLALLLPLGAYLGIILAYGRLYADNEMAILQMCGFGTRRLLRLTVWIGVVISAVILFLMLWVNPIISMKRQQIMESDEATVHLVQTLIPGRFQVSADGSHVMYVEKLSRNHERAENVFLAQQKKADDNAQHPWMLVLANQGYQIKDKATQDQFFITSDGFRYEGIPGQNDYKIVQYKKYAVRIPQSDMRVSHEESETLSTSQLWNDYANPSHAAELQWRVSIAIAGFLLALLAVPLSTVKPRQSRYLMMLPAIIIYVAYINALFVARRWVEQSIVSIDFGMWWVHGLMLVLVLSVFLYHSRRWR
jgi:lipopolysaccharide export system permease protein